MHMVLAMQNFIPLIVSNPIIYIVSENNPVNSKIRDFQSINKFKRSSNALLRISYPVKLGEKFIITTSLLLIYPMINKQII